MDVVLNHQYFGHRAFDCASSADVPSDCFARACLADDHDENHGEADHDVWQPNPELVVREPEQECIMHGDGTAAVRIWRDEGRMCREVRGQGAFDKPLVDREAPGPDLSSPRG